MSQLTLKALQEQINKLNEEVAILKANSKIPILKKKLGIGDTFELAKLTWKILDITEKGYICLANKFEDNMKFDNSSNDWRSSSLRKYLNEDFCEKLSAEIGEENIIPFERNLLSLDGQEEYGFCKDKVSLLNVDEYRKYRKLIPNANYWWWLITPDSTPFNGDSAWVRVVSSSGLIDDRLCNGNGGVRPFVSFSSVIFESEE